MKTLEFHQPKSLGIDASFPKKPGCKHDRWGIRQFSFDPCIDGRYKELRMRSCDTGEIVVRTKRLTVCIWAGCKLVVYAIDLS